MTTPSLIEELVKALENVRFAYYSPNGGVHEMQAALDAADKVLSHASAAQSEEWMPIESAPKDGTPVLIAVRGKHGWYIDCAENWFVENGCDDWIAREDDKVVAKNPSHWRPLPSPPSKQEPT